MPLNHTGFRWICQTISNPYKQLGSSGGHFKILVQLSACIERSVDLSIRQSKLKTSTGIKKNRKFSIGFRAAIGHSGQSNYSDDCRRYGVQSTESTTGHSIQQCQSTHKRVRRWCRGGLSWLRSHRREFRSSADRSNAKRHGSIKETAHRSGQQYFDLPNRARRRWFSQVPRFRGNYEPRVGRRIRTDVAKETVQWGILYDWHVPGGLNVREILFAKHFGCRK